MPPIRTVGHGTLSAEAFVALLRAAGVSTIADVRRFPGSRRHPHFGSEAMSGWLGDAGIAYRWLPSLGGRRRPDPASPNVGLRNEQFRAYADHMASEEFAEGVADVLALGDGVAVMCSESVWWRCHRRLIADFAVLARGRPVLHLAHDGRLTGHPPASGARLQENGLLVYDGE